MSRKNTSSDSPDDFLMFKKILIANRGEIAVRIARACRDLGISPIAVYSEADRAALHVRLADEAYLLGGAASAESYLRIDRLIDVARLCGAEAIHPGYGFLAERAEFARAVRDAGLVFIGPTPEAIEAMGSKTNARQAAIAAGAPVVPGTTTPLLSLDEARTVSAEIGYPVMLKAAAGGGGKGMRFVATDAEMTSAFDTAQAEALAAFGDGAVYLEKAIERPRHIEIQVFADTHGNVVHLGERECSIQRRHQKVIEESPSPMNDADLRERMGAASVQVTRSVGYTGAGTIEYLVSDVTRDFYFLEMNTRLQVEHPVTEMVTGFDIVREQITVAAGHTLSFTQADVEMRGHAIECRVYAEDPENNFLPSPGRITAMRVPTGPNVRNDAGVEAGDEVSIYYDPMISKLATWGRTRAEAIDRMRRALDEYTLDGIRTTLDFFRRVMRDDEFIQARLDTGFIERFQARRQSARLAATDAPAEPLTDERETIAAIVAALAFRDRQTTPETTVSADATPSQWRLSGRAALRR
jgi:acetyl-CoA carboxylase biotin carboxylase subunit